MGYDVAFHGSSVTANYLSVERLEVCNRVSPAKN